MMKNIASIIPFRRRRENLAQPVESVQSDAVPDIVYDAVPTPSQIASDVIGMTDQQKIRLFLNVVLAEQHWLADKHGVERATHMPAKLFYRRYSHLVKDCGFPNLSPKMLTQKLVAAGCKRKRLNDAARTTVIEFPDMAQIK
jgi:hypothetical protein